MTDASAPTATPAALKTRLSIMMFLQYAIWGAWLPLLYPFLKNHRQFEDAQIGTMFAVGAVGAIVAPFIAGQIADRYFSTEKYLGISHILGGVLVWQLATLEGFWPFLGFSLIYSLIYSPTLALTNSISFHHLPDRDRDFGKVRVWGTVGWIAVGIGIGQWLLRAHSPEGVAGDELLAAQWAGMADAFRLSALIGVGMGIFCFTLPHTPPLEGERENAVFEAMSEVKRNPLLTLFLLAVPISCIHQFYFVHTAGFLGEIQAQQAAEAVAAAAGGAEVQTSLADMINRIFGVGGGGLMTIGQMSEILVLAAIPLVAKSISRKTLLMIGTVAYALRMALFAYVDPITSAVGLPPEAILIPGIALHGLCFGCWIFVAFMVVDEETTPDVRASAQSLFNLVIVGIGIIVGSYIATGVASLAARDDGSMNYTMLFSVPMWASVGCLLILFAFYPKKSPKRGDIASASA